MIITSTYTNKKGQWFVETPFPNNSFNESAQKNTIKTEQKQHAIMTYPFQLEALRKALFAVLHFNYDRSLFSNSDIFRVEIILLHKTWAKQIRGLQLEFGSSPNWADSERGWHSMKPWKHEQICNWQALPNSQDVVVKYSLKKTVFCQSVTKWPDRCSSCWFTC